MTRWFSIGEIAKLALPGLPVSRNKIRRRALDEEWLYKDIPGEGLRGGARREYQIPGTYRITKEIKDSAGAADEKGLSIAAGSATPLAHAAASADANFGTNSIEARVKAGRARYLAAGAKGRKEGRDRANIVRAIRKDSSVKNAAERFGRKPKSVYAWLPDADGVDDCDLAMVLTPRWAGRKTDSIPEGLKKVIIDTLLFAPSAPRVTIPQIMRTLQRRFPECEQPGRHAVAGFVSRWKSENHSLYLKISNPDAFNSRCRTAIGDLAAEATAPNQIVEVDFTKADIMLKGDHRGEQRRVAVGQAIDRYSRRRVLWVSAGAPNGDETAQLLVRYISAFGMISTLVTDNGAEFINKQILDGLAALGIAHAPAPPYCGWRKPFVENGFGSLRNRIAELPGYCGNNVAARQEIRSRLSMPARRGLSEAEILSVSLTVAQFRSEIARVEGELNSTPSSGLMGLSPDGKAAQFDGEIVRYEDEAALRMILARGQTRVVGKEGIKYEGADFWADELVSYIGRTVGVIALADMGRLLVCSADRAHFITIAENPERTGKDRQVMALSAGLAQRRFIKDARKAIRGTKKKITAAVVADVLAAQSGLDPQLIITGNALRRAADEIAARGREAAPAAARPTPSAQEIAEWEERNAKREAERPLREFENDDSSLDNLWVGIVREGRELSEIERQFLARYNNSPASWCASYATTSEYRAMRRLEKLRAEEAA
jgi:transposase InsO family protein